MPRLFGKASIAAILGFLCLPFFFARPVEAASRAYAAGAVQGATRITMEAGSSKTVTLTFKNAGTYMWRGGASKIYVSLYATKPYPRESPFRHASWIGGGHVAKIDQALVRPGQSATVALTLRAPETVGMYDEQFQLAVENTAWIYNAAARLSIEVVSKKTAEADPINAAAYAVIDADSGEVLASKNADDVRNIASITKLMTVMVTRESGLVSEQTVALTPDDEVGGGRLRVPVGTVLDVPALLGSTIVGSANNTASALARATGLPRGEFLRRMDAKAREFGLAHTSFADPTGIEVGNVSTAREVALMARAAFQDPWIAPYAALRTYDVPANDAIHTIKNTNALLSDPEVTVVAGKTGFINEAGYTLVTRLKKAGERELIVSVLGSSTKARSFSDAKALAERAWRSSDLASR